MLGVQVNVGGGAKHVGGARMKLVRTPRTPPENPPVNSSIYINYKDS